MTRTLSVSAPGKIILFGEWAVLNGRTGVAMAVSPQLKSSWKSSSTPRDDSVILLRSEGRMGLWDPRLQISRQSQVPSYFRKAFSMLDGLAVRVPEARAIILCGGEWRIEREWALEWGLGSSSAIVACLLELFVPQKERLEKWNLGREILRDVQEGQASALDLAAQLRGSFVCVSSHKPKPLMNLNLPEEICFLHSGIKADTTELIKTQALSSSQSEELGKSCDEFIAKRDWLLSLQQHAKILEQSDIWPSELRNARQKLDRIGSCSRDEKLWSWRRRHLDDLV